MESKKTITMFDKIWVVLFTLLIMSSTIYYSWTATVDDFWLNWIISPISAITGVICVVLAARGKISTYIWGTVNCITYGYVAYKGGVYGDMIINLFFFLPFQLIGWIVWKKKMDGDVVKSAFLKKPITTMILGFISLFAFTKLLTSIDHWLTAYMQKSSIYYAYIEKIVPIKGFGAFLDATTEIGQFFGQVLMTWAKVEQWYAWIIVDIISIYMWISIITADSTSLPWAMPALIMWIGFLGNAFYGLYQWRKNAKVNKGV